MFFQSILESTIESVIEEIYILLVFLMAKGTALSSRKLRNHEGVDDSLEVNSQPEISPTHRIWEVTQHSKE